MKAKPSKTNLDRTASELAKLTQNYLDNLPPKERKKRLAAFKTVASQSSSSPKAPADNPSKATGTDGTRMFQIAARGRR